MLLILLVAAKGGFRNSASVTVLLVRSCFTHNFVSIVPTLDRVDLVIFMLVGQTFLSAQCKAR